MSFVLFNKLILLLFCIPPCLGVYTITGSSAYAVKGQSFLFTCNVDDSPTVISFSRGSKQICSVIIIGENCGPSPNDPRSTCGCNNANLFYANISDINTEDDTSWFCKNNAGTVSSPLNLTVYFGPENIRFNPSGDTVQVTEGARTIVECTADCKPDCIHYKWFKGNNVVSNNNTLSIINRDEAGSYTCRVQHPVFSSNSQTTDLTVNVIYGPYSVTFSTSSNLVLTEGTDQIVSCDADCNPTCIFSWYRDTVKINNNNLVFTSINRDQTGNYTCQATNSASTLTKTSVLSVVVNYLPSIESLSSTAVRSVTAEGSEVTFTCIADSRSRSRITWSTSDGITIATGDTMILKQLRCQNTDIYSCTVSNDVGHTIRYIPLYVQCTPTQRENLTKEVINRVGQSVTLEVDVYAYPVPTFKWRMDSTSFDLQAITTKSSLNSYKSSVEIILEQSSFGYYIIDVENDVGMNSFSIKVTDADEGENSLTVGIIGAVVGVVIGCVVTSLVMYVILKRKFKSTPTGTTNGNMYLTAILKPNESVTSDPTTLTTGDSQPDIIAPPSEPYYQNIPEGATSSDNGRYSNIGTYQPTSNIYNELDPGTRGLNHQVYTSI